MAFSPERELTVLGGVEPVIDPPSGPISRLLRSIPVGISMASQQAQPAAAAPNALLPPWANNQDGWCRTIAADILKNRAQPSNLDIDRYLKLLLAYTAIWKKASESTASGARVKDVNPAPLFHFAAAFEFYVFAFTFGVCVCILSVAAARFVISTVLSHTLDTA